MKLLLSIIFSVTLFLSVYSHNNDPTTSIKIVKNKQETFIYLFQNINFELNEIKINNSIKKQLFVVLSYLKQNQNLNIEIGVHSTFWNKNNLSQIRADVLKAFFVKYGINPKRIIAKGYGISKYLNKCNYYKACTEKQFNENRRINIKILNPSVLDDFIVVQK